MALRLRQSLSTPEVVEAGAATETGIETDEAVIEIVLQVEQVVPRAVLAAARPALKEVAVMVPAAVTAEVPLAAEVVATMVTATARRAAAAVEVTLQPV